jgi:hypothetical protein
LTKTFSGNTPPLAAGMIYFENKAIKLLFLEPTIAQMKCVSSWKPSLYLVMETMSACPPSLMATFRI